MKQNVMIISGKQGEGKTTFVKQLVRLLNSANIPCAGFYAEGYWNENLRSGFDLVEINGELRKCLCNLVAGENDIAFRRYFFKKDALQMGAEILAKNEGAQKVVFVDEAGMLELEGKGWASAIERLMLNPPLALVLTVRETNLKGVCEKFRVNPVFTWNISDTSPVKALADIVSINPSFNNV